MADQISGTVKSVIYNKATYYILDVNVRGKSLTAKGNLFGVERLATGVPIVLKGKWVKTRKYGRQLQIKAWDLPHDTSGTLKRKFLEYAAGFDAIVASVLVEGLGEHVFEKLSNIEEIKRLFPGLGSDLDTALLRWSRMQAVRDLSDVLKGGGLSASDIEAAVTTFGTGAPQLIKENPFRLMEIPGFSFEKTDRLALTLGFDSSNPQRLEGAALWALREAGRGGHLYLRRGEVPTLAVDLKDTMGPLPITDAPDRGFKAALAALEGRGSIKVELKTGAYTKDSYEHERGSALMLTRLMAPSPLQVELAPFLEEFERSSHLELSATQQDAVGQLIDHKVLVLTGLPGTGKTTAVKALVRLFEVSRTSFSLMAPTGIASKRLSHVTAKPASTIHRALGYDGMNWKHGPSNKMVVDAVIVDEVSMVDQELFYRLLSSLRDDTMLVLVGDDAQLPSVGPGNILRELVSCEGVPSVRLTEIFRQSKQGDIVLNSHKINRGEMPTLGSPKGDSEFRFVPLTSEEKARDLIVSMALRLKAKDANFQVLSPKYSGPVGVDSLNIALRDALNPQGPPEWLGKKKHFRLGDRLMIVKNNYQKGIFNGDVGKLLFIGKEQIVVRVYGVGKGTDLEVSFTESEADSYLRLAYAITVHKSQGSEFDTVILPVTNSQGRMLQRNLLYTAVTRAKKRVWIVGEKSAIQRSVENNKVQRRNTHFGAAVSGVLEEAL